MTDTDLIARADAALDGVTPDRCYLIKKNGLYYRPNCKGYTTSATQAGRYTLDEAIKESHPNGPDGPRDGMTYQHENDARDDDWLVVRELRQLVPALRDALVAALTRQAETEDALAAFASERDRLRVENARLRELFGKIAQQKRTDEVAAYDDPEIYAWDDGFDSCVNIARAALTGEQST